MLESQGIILARISSPAKIILCGQHAVVYGQDALAMGISLRCRSLITQIQQSSNSKTISLCLDSQSFFIRETALENLCSYSQYINLRKEQGQINEDKIKYQYKFQQFRQYSNMKKQLSKSYQIKIDSDIPIGKCLGSSAAFNTVLAASFCYIWMIREQKLWKELDFCQINKLSYIFEAVQHGNPSGIDNYVSTYGGLVLYNNKKQPKFQRICTDTIIKNLTKQVSLYLIDSGILKNTKKAVQIVKNKIQSNEYYKNKIHQIGTYATKIIQLLKISKQQSKFEILEIIKQNHVDLRELGISIPQIQNIVNDYTIDKKQSVKITGAGMGGFVLLVSIVKQLKKEEKIIQVNFEDKGLIIEYISKEQ